MKKRKSAAQALPSRKSPRIRNRLKLLGLRKIIEITKDKFVSGDYGQRFKVRADCGHHFKVFGDYRSGQRIQCPLCEMDTAERYRLKQARDLMAQAGFASAL